MGNLSNEQKKLLADFCSNFSIAWFAGGLIAPLLTKQPLEQIGKSIISAIILGGTFLITGLSLVKGGKKK